MTQRLVCSIFLSLFYILPAHSSQSNNVTTVVEERSVFEALKPNAITYFNIFTGPSIGNGRDPVNEFGAIEEGGVSTWGQFSFAWNISERFQFIANPTYVINHNSNDPDVDEYEFDNPVVGIQGLWFKKGKFSVGGNVTTLTPALRTDAAIADGIIFNPGGFQSANYEINHSWSAGAWMFGRVMIYDRDITSADDRYFFWLAPKTTYRFNDKLSATLFYQLNGEGDHESNLNFTRNDSLNLMISFQISRYLVLEPIFTTFRESDYDPSSANFGMWISGRLF